MSLAAFALHVLLAAAAQAAEGPAAREQARRCEELSGEEGLAACRQAIALGLAPLRRDAVRELLARRLVSLERWETGREYDRLGLREERYRVLGADLPLVRMPVAPGRNLAILVEVAARNQLLKTRGYDAARRFAEQVDEMIAAEGPEARVRKVALAPRRAGRRKRGHA